MKTDDWRGLKNATKISLKGSLCQLTVHEQFGTSDNKNGHEEVHMIFV